MVKKPAKQNHAKVKHTIFEIVQKKKSQRKDTRYANEQKEKQYPFQVMA